jgi:hypothetical protein
LSSPAGGLLRISSLSSPPRAGLCAPPSPAIVSVSKLRTGRSTHWRLGRYLQERQSVRQQDGQTTSPDWRWPDDPNPPPSADVLRRALSAPDFFCSPSRSDAPSLLGHTGSRLGAGMRRKVAPASTFILVLLQLPSFGALPLHISGDEPGDAREHRALEVEWNSTSGRGAGRALLAQFPPENKIGFLFSTCDCDAWLCDEGWYQTYSLSGCWGCTKCPTKCPEVRLALAPSPSEELPARFICCCVDQSKRCRAGLGVQAPSLLCGAGCGSRH